MSPEGDESDERSYQVPADIADNGFTDSTILSSKRMGGEDSGKSLGFF
jgi:hypothetical protein